jgi:hypothetical protein
MDESELFGTVFSSWNPGATYHDPSKLGMLLTFKSSFAWSARVFRFVAFQIGSTSLSSFVQAIQETFRTIITLTISLQTIPMVSQPMDFIWRRMEAILRSNLSLALQA